jgi:hypothetical protein
VALSKYIHYLIPILVRGTVIGKWQYMQVNTLLTTTHDTCEEVALAVTGVVGIIIASVRNHRNYNYHTGMFCSYFV